MRKLKYYFFLMLDIDLKYILQFMKYRTYFITLFAYMTVHFLRVSVPFIQLDL